MIQVAAAAKVNLELTISEVRIDLMKKEQRNFRSMCQELNIMHYNTSHSRYSPKHDTSHTKLAKLNF